MKDQSRTKQALIQELASLRQRIAEPEQSELVRKSVEYTLWKSKKELQWLFKSMINAFVLFESVFDDDGNFISYRFVHINDAYERITGVKNEEVTGKTVHEVWPETEPEWIKRYGEVAVTGASQTFELYHAPTKKLYHCNVYRPWDTKDHFCVIFEDITERKQVEEALRRSEENFRRSLDESPLGVRIVTIEGETLYANRAILDIHGYDSLEELKTTPTEKRYTPESYAEHQIRREKRKRGDDVPSEYEISIVRKDGEVRHLQTFRKEISWDAERQFQVLYSDITERKRAEDALRISEEQFRRLSEAAFEAIAIHDEGVLLNANNQFFEMFGYEPGEVIGKQVMPMTVAPEAREFMTKKIATGDLGPYESIGLRKDGTRFPMEIRTRHMKYKELNVRVGAIRDITESKQADKALRKSQEKLREAHRLAHMGVWNWVAETDTVTWTEELYLIAGLDPLLPAPTYAEHPNIYAPESWDLLKEAVERAMKTGGTYQLELKLIRPDGTTRWVNAFGGATYDNHGRIEGLQGTVQDITSRKRAEEKLTISHKQLRALAGRIQQIREEERVLISREIHDELGGGLTGLKMDLSWLLRKMGNADPGEERVALMDKIHTSNALIDQMIKIVRRISADLRPSVLDDLGMIAALSWQSQEFTRRTEIQCEFVTSIDYINLEDETAIGVFRVFQEALTNVIRHSQATKVVVVLREDERSLFGNESLVLEIRDNGRGITEEEILNPESLGLLGMKERVLAFGGEFSIRGEPGGGTSLVLQIPRHKILSLQA